MSTGRSLRPKQVAVTLTVPLLGEISGTWEPDEAERNAAWELYVELVTRVSAVELPQGQGLLREALSSLHALFGVTRDILRRYGPAIAPARSVGELSFGVVAVTVLNGSLRPLLTQWHPLLRAHEETRPDSVDPVAHERAWPREPELRAALEETRGVLTDLADLLGEIAGAADLRSAPQAHSQNRAGGGELTVAFRCRQTRVDLVAVCDRGVHRNRWLQDQLLRGGGVADQPDHRCTSTRIIGPSGGVC